MVYYNLQYHLVLEVMVGDLENWTGTDFNTGIAYSTNDLSIAGEGGVQMSWDQRQPDWGLNTTLDYDANQDNQAVQLSFASNIGKRNR